MRESLRGFDARFQQLAERAALVPHELVEPDDDHAEHMRFAVYRLVVDHLELRPLLLSCLADDPDPLMASDVLVRLLEQVEPAERQDVVDITNTWRADFREQQEFVRAWARDLDVLGALRMDEPNTSAIRYLLEGSDRLQRRAVEDVSSQLVLEGLEEHGRTRRVRKAAGEKLRSHRRISAGRREADPTACS